MFFQISGIIILIKFVKSKIYGSNIIFTIIFYINTNMFLVYKTKNIEYFN